MAIPIKNHVNYGGNLITQKYSPLEINDVGLDESAEAQYKALFNGRINYLANQRLFPSVLHLYTDSFQGIQAREMAASAKPPIVVVSSNRAKWIKEISDTVTELLPANKKHFDNVNDVRALVADSTPWYHPKRINDPGIHVYVLVHQLEFKDYRTALDGTGMQVVGWSFAEKENRKIGCVGFGPSRYAAVEFCKYIFNTPLARRAGTPAVARDRQQAWIIDDNVIHIGGFPGFDDVVDVMRHNNDIWGIGFDGATQNANGAAAVKRIHDAQYTKADLGNMTAGGILQQCVLWNIDKLNRNFHNFSPYFASSNEDTSLSGFLADRYPGSVQICSNTRICKGEPKHDNGANAKRLTSQRSGVQGNYFKFEGLYQVSAPVLQEGDQPLGRYVRKWVLPNAQENVRNEPLMITDAKAVEQMMAKVAKSKVNWIPGTVFRPNGQARQLVRHQNVR